MLIRLLPLHPHPTILFAVSFQNLPEDLPLPWSWSNQLNALSLDDLELPPLVHCLDKAAALPCLLEEVTFNIPSHSISCRLIDGTLQEWQLSSQKCLQLLECVIRDVNESASETEKEREREKPKETKSKVSSQSETLNSPPGSLKVKGHKRQRSLLMSLVASLVPSSSRPSPPATVSSEPEPPPEIPLPPSPPPLKPRALRRRARSTLVDVFRLYVQPHLRSRMPSEGFHTWVLQSMLSRSHKRLDELVQCTNMTVDSLLRESYFSHIDAVPTPPEEEDDLDTDTDTDGSSVHTPSLTSRCPVEAKPVSNRHMSVEQEEFSPVREAKTLAATCVRLRHLLILANAQQVHTEHEQMQKEAMLEIRSRRRAWLNKTLVGKASTDAGLAMPFKSSRLAQTSWSADDYEYAPGHVGNGEDEGYEDKLALGLRRTRGVSDAKLFPVTEEDDGLESDSIDLEFDSDDPRLPANARMRTTSMHERPSDKKNDVSIICRPLPIKKELHPPVYDAYGYSPFVEDEFTLAMDIPSEVDNRAMLPQRKLYPLVACEEREWFPQVVAVDCR